MGVSETGVDVENVGGKVGWTTGDAEKDWARYQGLFDRIDAEARHRMVCLIVLSGVLLFALIAAVAAKSLGGSQWLSTTLELFLPWVGLSASMAVYWSQYHAHEQRRELQRIWIARYSTEQPAPYGLPMRDPGTPHGVPAVLLGLLSSIFWLFVFGSSLARVWPGGRGQGPNVVHQIQFFGVLILGVASIVVFYGVVATHFANKGQEDNQC